MTNEIDQLRTRLSTAERERDFWKHNFNAILLQAKQAGCSEIDVGLEDGSTNRVLRNDLADTLKARVEELEKELERLRKRKTVPQTLKNA